MANLKELLESLDIDLDDPNDKNNQDDKDEKDDINLKDINLDDIPEAQRPIFKKLMDQSENLTNELAKSNLIINTLKTTPTLRDQQNNKSDDKEDKNKDDKVLGTLDKDDPYAPLFLKLAESIDNLSTQKIKDEDAEFKRNIQAFAKDHKDIFRYVKDMDMLLIEHPSLVNDIPKLYTLAKTINTGREQKSNEKKEEINKIKNLNNFRIERSGMSGQNASDITNAKTIEEAFNLAVEQKTK